MAKINTSSSLTRIVIAAMGIFGGLQFLTILCSVIRVKLTALWVGPAGVGLVTVLFAALTMVSNFTQLGLRTTAVRHISAAPTPQRPAIGRLISRLSLILGLGGAIVMLITAPLFSYETFHTLTSTPSFLLLAPATLLLALTAARQAEMQANGMLRPLARTTLHGTIGGLILSIPIIYLMRLNGLPLTLLAYAAAGYIATLRTTLPSHTAPTPTLRHTWTQSTPTLRLGLYLTLGTAITDLLAYIFTAYLTRTAHIDTVGIYQSGYTIVSRYVGMLFTAIGVEYFPRLSTVIASPRRTRAYVAHELLLLTLILIPVTTLLIPLAPLVIHILYTPLFTPAVPLIIAAMPGTILRGASWCIAFVIIARGDGRLYIITETLSGIIGLILNIICYRHWGLTGLGLSFTLWYIAYLLIVATVYRHIYRLTLPPRPLKLILLALTLNILTALLALHLHTHHLTPLYTLPIPLLTLPPTLITLRRLLKK